MTNLQKFIEEIKDSIGEIEDDVLEEVDHPKHYNELPAVCRGCGDPIECISVVREMNFNLGNAIKYLWRTGHKGDNPTTDLRKAIWYIEDEIKRLEKK